MIVVSNTSPLTNLAAIGQFDMLGHLYPGFYLSAPLYRHALVLSGEMNS